MVGWVLSTERKGFDMSEMTIDQRNALAEAWKLGVLAGGGKYGETAVARFNALLGNGTAVHDLVNALAAGAEGESFSAFVARHFPEGGAA